MTNEDDKFRRLMDAAPDAMVIANPDGTIEYVNRQAEQLFGYAKDELLGRTIEALIPMRARAAHVGHRERFVSSPKTRAMGSGLELFAQRKDGTEVAVEISLSPLETAQGTVVSAAIRDITDRKRIEARARRAADHLRSAVETIQGAFALYDSDDSLALCNSTALTLFGHQLRGPAVGQKWEALLDASLDAGVFDVGDEGRERFRERWLAYHRSPVGTFDVSTRSGLRLRVTERRTPEGGTVSTIWDLTEDVEREVQLRRAQEAAEAASSAKSEFLASMSHELRTPMNAVLGFAQLLQRDKKTPLTDRQKGMLDHVIRGGEHLLRLIDEILDLSRIEAGRITVSPEPVGMTEILREVAVTLEPMASRVGATLVTEPVPEDLPNVVADRTRLAQVLMNFGSNAIKYGKPQGRVSLRAELQPSGRVRAVVTDDGAGIPLDQQERIFQPFHRAGQETGPIEGTGIGLAISKKLAEVMNGSVGFHSSESGSSFWIELPAARVASEKGELVAPFGRPRAPLASAGSTHRVVYVEDNPANVAFMEALLATLDNIQLMSAPSAELGVELVRAHRPDVVIMDINLPGITGLEATRRLREWPETREIPIIALSAAAMPRDTERAKEFGFHAYLTKPVKVDELLGLLENILVPG